MTEKNYTKYSQNNDLNNLSKTGYSNSRLSGNFFTTSQPKLSFDAMTIVGNLTKNNAEELSNFMSIEPQIRLWDILGSVAKLNL
ncbi:replication initiation protein RepD [Staphylococcus hominis]